mmetsp:Transcript_3038/g.6925  ORF Transcript_3038/g.6925 Transcript_3038/m.6925 type:complete len:337 (-) Transcript_3038:2901-3911(-)
MGEAAKKALFDQGAHQHCRLRARHESGVRWNAVSRRSAWHLQRMPLGLQVFARRDTTIRALLGPSFGPKGDKGPELFAAQPDPQPQPLMVAAPHPLVLGSGLEHAVPDRVHPLYKFELPRAGLGHPRRTRVQAPPEPWAPRWRLLGQGAKGGHFEVHGHGQQVSELEGRAEAEFAQVPNWPGRAAAAAAAFTAQFRVVVPCGDTGRRRKLFQRQRVHQGTKVQVQARRGIGREHVVRHARGAEKVEWSRRNRSRCHVDVLGTAQVLLVTVRVAREHREPHHRTTQRRSVCAFSPGRRDHCRWRCRRRRSACRRKGPGKGQGDRIEERAVVAPRKHD